MILEQLHPTPEPLKAIPSDRMFLQTLMIPAFRLRVALAIYPREHGRNG